MFFLEELKQKIITETALKDSDFFYPPSAKLGDLSGACFIIAKEQKKNPVEVAQAMVVDLENNKKTKKYFIDIKAVGPYINFFIKPQNLAEKIIGEIKREKKNYGHNNLGNQHRIMIEYSNANTHKEYHVGHLRNIAYGESIKRLLQANGYQTVPVSYINDFGIHVAKTIWNWQRYNYQSNLDNKGYLLGKCYSEASQLLDKEPQLKEEVGHIMKEIESRQGPFFEKWQETRDWSIKYFDSIYKELDVKFDHIFYENEVIADGLKLVNNLIEKKIFVKSQGAIIADLEKYNLGILPIIRSDGTALYPVADLALASEKFNKYHLDESIYVVDVRQGLYFKQLFRILELSGYQQKLTHLAYDFVTLPEGMMSSRTGQVITYEELKKRLIDKLINETRQRHNDWTNNRVEQVAHNLAISTIKFEMLKVNANKIITFNIEEAARFDGYTACYLQYGYARLKSIIRKEKFNLFKYPISYTELNNDLERELLIKLARYPEIVFAANQKYDPSELAKYLFELVQLSNDYYHGVNILKAESKVCRARLTLIKAIAQVLNNGLELLGINVLEEM